MEVSYSRLFLYGFVTYASIFMLWSLLSAYGLAYGWAAQTMSYALTAAIVFLAARWTSVRTLRAAFVYGVGWTLEHIFLDAVYVIPATGVVAFTTWFVWIGYAIVFFVPLFVTLQKIRAETTANQTSARIATPSPPTQ